MFIYELKQLLCPHSNLLRFWYHKWLAMWPRFKLVHSNMFKVLHKIMTPAVYSVLFFFHFGTWQIHNNTFHTYQSTNTFDVIYTGKSWCINSFGNTWQAKFMQWEWDTCNRSLYKLKHFTFHVFDSYSNTLLYKES